MTLKIFVLLVTLSPAAVFAQQKAASTNVDRVPQVKTGENQQPALYGPFPVRRRGSMVGYVDDAIIENKVRVRFDTALHNRAPDRAEFFYAKCGCYRGLSGNDAFDPDAPGPGPGAANDINFQQLNVWGEYALSNRFSVFAQFPVRWIQPKSFVAGTGAPFPNQTGLSDVRAGAKAGLATSPDLAVTGQVQVYFPSGDASKGLGVNHASIEPTLLYYQRRDRIAVESQVGLWMPLGGSAGVPTHTDGHFSGNVLYYGVGPSVELFSGDRVQFAPVAELVGWRVLGGFNTTALRAADGTNILTLKLGARTSFSRGSIYIGYGHTLSDASWYEDIVRFEYRVEF